MSDLGPFSGMRCVWQQIKSGAWLTRERLHGYALILLTVSLAAGVIWIALADGLIDRTDKPIGTDFSNVWAAGKLVLDGQPAAPYEPARQYAAEKEAFGGREVPFFGWHYPPQFLIVAAGARAPALWLGSGGMDAAHVACLPGGDARHSAQA